MLSRLDHVKFKKPPQKFVEGKPFFASDFDYHEATKLLRSDFILWLKSLFKYFPRLYSFIFYVIAPALFLGKSPKSIFKFVPTGGLVAEIGSGNRRLHPDIINVDIHPWRNVDIVADAHDLPFESGTFDGLVSSWVLEHLPNPKKVIEEMSRVLKIGGYVYLSTNFVMTLHPSPKDYYRWTSDGLRELFSGWDIVDVKPIVGPTSALLYVSIEWLSMVLSFNIKIIKDFFWILLVMLTFPIKLLDLIFIHYRSAEAISCGLYVIARKK